MKMFILFIVALGVQAAAGQEGYPVPPNADGRLFYIQHSNNHNTFVYDANFSGYKKLDANEPVTIYRINYEDGGVKEPLTSIQRKMAYGISFKNKGQNVFEFSLAAYPEKTLLLKLHSNGKPYVSVTVNGKPIVLRKMFLYCNKLGTKVSHIDFYGTDASHKDVKERFFISK
jgi:hypothetical protein